MSPFAESVWSAAERELGIDEKVTVRSLSQDTRFIPNLKMVVRKGNECVREYLEQVNGEEGAHSDQDCAAGGEDDTFVDIMKGVTLAASAESEVFTFANALKRVNLSNKTIAKDAIDTSELPTRYFFFFLLINFSCKNNLVAIHSFHRLVYSARLYMNNR